MLSIVLNEAQLALSVKSVDKKIAVLRVITEKWALP